jgi:type I restriction enzyme, S subunit
MDSIPEGWQEKKLGDLIVHKKGYAFKSDLFSDIGDVPVIKVSNMTDHSVDLKDCVYVSQSVANEYLDYQVKHNDVVMTTAGSRPPIFSSMVGKVIRIPKVAHRALLNQNAVILKSGNQITDDYLYSILNTDRFIFSHIVSIVTGNANQVSISLKDIFSYKFPLPPLAEQKAIAQILGTWDEAIQVTEALIDALGRRKQGLMQRLLTGEVRFPEFEGDEYRTAYGKQFPANWNVLEYKDIVTKRKEKFNPKLNDDVLPCVELEHIEQGTGRLLGNTTTEHQKSTKNVFSAKDILFGKLRPYLKKYAQPDFDGVSSSEIWVFQGKEHIITNDFLFLLVQSERFMYLANVTSGTKMPRADWNYLSEFSFAIPLPREQKKMVEVIGNADKEIMLLSNELKSLQEQKRGLMQVLLTGQVRVNEHE